MTISYGAVGASSNGTTSLSVSYPGGISAGQMLLLVVANKYPANGPATPSGWTLLAQASGGSGSAGVGTGSVYSTVFWREADGSESGSVSVTLTGGNSAVGRIYRFSKTVGSWALAAASGADNTAGTSWSVTTGALDLASGDLVVTCSAANDDSPSYASHGLSASGITFDTLTEVADTGTNQGDDCKTFVAYAAVTAGSGSGAVTYTATANASGTDFPAGATVVVRLRESTGYTLAVDTGAFTLAGQAVALPLGRAIVATATGFTLTGQGAGLLRGLHFPVDAGAFALAGQTVALNKGFILAAGTGALTLTGQAASLLRQLLLAAAAGDFTLAGQAVGLNRGFGFAAEPGGFDLAGQDAALLRQLLLAAAAGGFTLTGQDAALAKTILLVAGTAAFVLTGQAATLTYTRLLYPARQPAVPVVHLLEATPFDESVSDTLSAVPAPFGAWAFAGDPEFDVVTGGSETIYAADGWFNSLPADTPANQHYRPVLVSPFNAQISLFEGIEPAGRASVGFGEIVLHNGDGWLDDVIDLGWSGRPITLYRGVPFAARSSFTLVFTGALDGLTPDEQQVSLRLRTREALLDRPLQATLYHGSGGKEGGADLVGKRKPVAYGRLLNVPGVLIDSANLVYQISDLPVNQISAVRDKGVALAFDTDYASYTLLVAATISSGDYATCLAEGMVRLGGAPEGQVTIDCRGADNGDSPGGYPETAGAIIRRIVTTRLDTVNLVDPDDLDTDSFDQLETDQPAPIGFWDGPDSSLTVGQALDQIMASIGGWWTFTLPGKLSVAVLKAPSGDADAVLTRADIVFGPFALQGGVPSYRRLVGYQRMWAIQAQDSLAGAVTAADKLLYSTQYRYALTTDAAVLAKHRNARDVLTAGLFALQADAETEAARLQALHGVERRVVSVGVRPDNPFDAPLGGVVEVQGFNRLGLSSSKKYRLIGLVVDLASGETTWVLWG